MTEVIRTPRLATDANGVAIQSPLHPFATGNIINVAGAATASAKDTLANVRVVRLIATEACWIKFARTSTAALTVVADTDGMYLPKDMPEYFTVRGSDEYIGCIKATGGAGAGLLVIQP